MAIGAVKALLRQAGYRIERIPTHVLTPADTRLTGLIRALWPVATAVPLIRAGGEKDGAYLVPDDLDGIEALFSPGVDKVAEFEAAMAERGMTCYLADASVDGPPVDHPAFRFTPKFLGLTDDERTITLDSWVEANAPGNGDLMLQMDIEGHEWSVLANASARLLARFRVMVIEFHFLATLPEPLAQTTVAPVLERLCRTHHVVHSHVNNCIPLNSRHGRPLPELLELTFLRKDRAQATGFITQFPHPLDIVNVPGQAPIVLPPDWHAPLAVAQPALA